MKHILAFLAASAFANSNAASKMYVSATPVPDLDMTQADFEAIDDWTEIRAVGNRGETGKNTNVLTYDTWDTTVIQKAKGMTDAGSPEIEVARIPTDPGQEILRAGGAVGNNNNYAFREVRADGAIGGTGTIKYNRGMIAGPRSPGGRNEDFDLEVFTLLLQQEEIVVNPTIAGNPPVLTVAPVITGTAEVGEVLSLSNGTFTGDATITYEKQWFAGGVAIPGANAATFTLTSAQLGKVITGRTTARNNSGSAFGFSAPTTAVIA